MGNYSATISRPNANTKPANGNGAAKPTAAEEALAAAMARIKELEAAMPRERQEFTASLEGSRVTLEMELDMSDRLSKTELTFNHGQLFRGTKLGFKINGRDALGTVLIYTRNPNASEEAKAAARGK